MGIFKLIKTVRDIQNAKKFLKTKAYDINKLKEYISMLQVAIKYLQTIIDEGKNLIKKAKEDLQDLKEIKGEN